MSRAELFGARKKEREKRLLGTLQPSVKELEKKWGSKLHLVPDTLLLAGEVVDNTGRGWMGNNVKNEAHDALTCLLWEPLLASLQDPTIISSERCQHCQPELPVNIVSVNRSGSGAEGLSDVKVGRGGTSDFDVMFEFGCPFNWAGAGAEPAIISPQSAPQLWAKPTDNIGFVTLYWVPTTECRHMTALDAFPTNSLRSLMLNICQVMTNGEITIAGPAVNVQQPCDPSSEGIDYVACLRARGWWPADDWLEGNRQRRTDFPPSAVRDNIREFGVHLVPTGRKGSPTERKEYRISLSRAEIVAARFLHPVQRTVIKTMKGMKQIVKEKWGKDLTEGLKSYFIKTSMLWLAQDTPMKSWTNITDGVHRVLDWLEEHLAPGTTMPCFFYAAIDVAAELTPEQRQNAINAVKLMRTHATRLMLELCMNEKRDFSVLTEDDAKPPSERQLRRRLARILLRDAVVNGTLHRPTAPCWESWVKSVIPSLIRAAQTCMLQWCFHRTSGTNWQQCYMLMAWSVLDRQDLAGAKQPTSPSDEVVTLDAAPLMAILTASDLEVILGDPAAVSAWCRQQLQRPPGERPGGLTADLDTPRGRVELLLQPELLLQAVREAVPQKVEFWKSRDDAMGRGWMVNYFPPRTYHERLSMVIQHLDQDLRGTLGRIRPDLDGTTLDAKAKIWRRELEDLWSGGRLRRAVDAARKWPDNWNLAQFYVAKDTGKTHQTRSDATVQHQQQ
ncbi:uncharacterized protein LOC122393925 [Amphibalanus amphitrite]|uniref:uncharacterized protein LOC122393925 n=1 Tax=Amphibalanus amphitrite TaxID=1232801 RepID=UPI001C909034|nr:uncharacterized protein LOC122393925 [Amphibalanus amphitrite]XP_043246340.1 uncharacterized protein LOC122393925 [Amphibalanus amphitrite]